MKILSYNDIEIQLLRCTIAPGELVRQAVDLTMKKDGTGKDLSKTLAQFLWSAEHHSMFEHANGTFLIKNCSRSLLAQMTRQRTFKPTSASQHYQDYRDYPCVVHPELVNDFIMRRSLESSFKDYTNMVDRGVAVEEARQALPNAACVNLMVTFDARNLAYFFRQRRCERNVLEMKMVADAMYSLAREWFPNFFSLVGPPCFKGKCNQGHLMAAICKEKPDADFT